MSTIKGYPTPAQTILLLDSQSSVVKAAWFSLAAIQTVNASSVAKMFGDGSSGNPGLGNADWVSNISGALQSQATFFRPDKVFRRLVTGLGGFMSSFDTQVKSYIPSGRNYVSGGVIHAFDAYLSRQNGLWGGATGTPTPPAVAASWALTPTTGGSIPAVASGSAPRIVVTYIGASDYMESLPSTPSAQMALNAPNSAYQIAAATLGSTVPAGVKKIGVYRQLTGGTGAYYFDHDVPVTAGAAFPIITINNPDSVLRQDFSPPSWASCLMTPEAACLFAITYSTSFQGGLDVQPIFSATGMISANNVAAGPANLWDGIGNVGQESTLLTINVTGDTAATTTAGTLQTTNLPSQAIQGFAGCLGLQARITGAIGGAATLTIGYVANTSVTGMGTTTTGSVSVTFSSGALGTVAVFSIANDANGNAPIIKSATFTSISGAVSAGGSIVIEGAFPRSY